MVNHWPEILTLSHHKCCLICHLFPPCETNIRHLRKLASPTYPVFNIIKANLSKLYLLSCASSPLVIYSMSYKINTHFLFKTKRPAQQSSGINNSKNSPSSLRFSTLFTNSLFTKLSIQPC